MPLLIAIAASAVIILSSPFMGQLQAFLRRSLSTHNYVLLFGGGVFAAVGAAIIFAFFRIRERRAERLSLLAIALLVAASYMWVNGTPYPEVNAVERVHLIEYGIVGVLFYRVWQDRSDWSSILLPLLAGSLVGTLDELTQWFIPVRVGEAHDVFVDVVSVACGLLFALALMPPAALAGWRPGSIRRVSAAAAIAWLVFAVFVGEVHLGHAIDEPGIGEFRSHYTPDQLNALQADRAARWKIDPPLTLHRLSKEDQYLDEGLWHVRRRNLTEPPEAWRENLILEKYFVPVLDTPTYASPRGNRWAAEQRADIESRLAASPIAFVSAAEPYPIVTMPAMHYWLVVVVVAMALSAVAVRAA